MKKRILALLLTVVLCLGATACVTASDLSETFTYGDYVYMIDIVPDKANGGLVLVLEALEPVAPGSVATPATEIPASEILSLLGYDKQESFGELAFALSDKDDTPIVVSNAQDFGGAPDANPYYPAAGSANDIIVFVQKNGIKESVVFADQKAVIVNDRTLIPARGLFEMLGYTVSWDSVARAATVKNSSMEVVVPIDVNKLIVNGVEKAIDVPAQIINDRTMLPVRVISEAFGLGVEWNGTARIVTVIAQ